MSAVQPCYEAAAYAVPLIGDTEAVQRRPRAAISSWVIQVLLVDDNEADAAIAHSILRRHPDVGSVVIMTSAEEALSKLAAGRLAPHLILLDIQMPRMDGFKFIEALDHIPDARDTPVVMLTTSRFERDVAEARRVRANGYIVKPDTIEEYRTRLDTVIKLVKSGQRG